MHAKWRWSIQPCLGREKSGYDAREKCPDRELNPDLILRRDSFYPLNYRGAGPGIDASERKAVHKSTKRPDSVQDITRRDQMPLATFPRFLAVLRFADADRFVNDTTPLNLLGVLRNA
jgi:hypothetical protein